MRDHSIESKDGDGVQATSDKEGVDTHSSDEPELEPTSLKRPAQVCDTVIQFKPMN
jgi:hypothetical protein